LVVTFRPEFQDVWSSQPQVTMQALNRLSSRDCAVLVQQLAGNAGLSHDTVDEIVERTDGVPLFVEEVTKAVVEAGAGRLALASIQASSRSAGDAACVTAGAPRSARLGGEAGGADRRCDRP